MYFPSNHASLLLLEHGEDAPRPQRWEAVHARYHAVILVWCRRRGLTHACAEDLTQEIWLKLLREISRYDPAKGRFRSWLKAVVNNALTDFWRRQQRRPERRGIGGTAFLERVAPVADRETTDEQNANERQASAAAAQTFARVRARLHETTWQAFYQTVVEKRPAKEVAQDLGLSIASVYKNTHRVKQMLREAYGHVHPSDHEAVPAERDSPGRLTAALPLSSVQGLRTS